MSDKSVHGHINDLLSTVPEAIADDRWVKDAKATLCEAHRRLNESSAVDLVDMMRDEFQRIAACPGADAEIRELCQRAIERTDRRVPVVAELEATHAALRAQRQALQDLSDWYSIKNDTAHQGALSLVSVVAAARALLAKDSTK